MQCPFKVRVPPESFSCLVPIDLALGTPSGPQQYMGQMSKNLEEKKMYFPGLVQRHTVPNLVMIAQNLSDG